MTSILDTRPRVIALMGATASGKSAYALDLAHRLGGEIVSVDSALVYRGLDIGAAKPTRNEQARVPHHLMDLRNPWQPYSAAEFAVDATAAIDDILARGKLPILAGGTGLYFRALLEGLAPMPESDAAQRAAITADAQARGWAALHADLARVDPAAALRIHVTDAQRIQRAVEVYRLSGRAISDWQTQSRPARPGWKVLKLVLAPPDRSVLHAGIEHRFDAMLAEGFLDEVRALRGRPELAAHTAPLALPAIRAVGYRQAWQFLDGSEESDADAGTFRERAIAATRQLAKRQFTWLRRELDGRWFDPVTQRTQLDAAVAGFLGDMRA